MAAYIFKLQVTNLSFDRRTFCTSLSSVEIHFQLNRYFTTFIVFSTSRLFIYLCTTFIKRIIHNLICSDALCMRNNVQGTFYIMFCKFMQFNKIFKTIFEYIRKKFRFVHTNTFCEYRKNYAHRLACILFFYKKSNFWKYFEKKSDQNIHQNAQFFYFFLNEHTHEPFCHAIYTLLKKKYLHPSVKACNVCAFVAFWK